MFAALEARQIQTRPISGSNLARQPVFEQLEGVRVDGSLTVADAVHERGFFVGQSHVFDERQGQYLARSLSEIFSAASIENKCVHLTKSICSLSSSVGFAVDIPCAAEDKTSLHGFLM